MFTRSDRSKNRRFTKEKVSRWLSWLAQKMIEHQAVPYLLESMQPKWLSPISRSYYKLIGVLIVCLSVLLLCQLTLLTSIFGPNPGTDPRFYMCLSGGLIGALLIGSVAMDTDIEFAKMEWNWRYIANRMVIALPVGLIFGLITSKGIWQPLGPMNLLDGLKFGLALGLVEAVLDGWKNTPVRETTYFGQKKYISLKNSFVGFLLILLAFWFFPANDDLKTSMPILGLVAGLGAGLFSFGWFDIIRHSMLLLIIKRNRHIPWRLVPFLNHCVDLIFLRRVGGGYIFVHRMLMEHFADMYPADEK